MRQRDKRFLELSKLNKDLEGLEKLKKELGKLDYAEISINPIHNNIYINSYYYVCDLDIETIWRIYRKIGLGFEHDYNRYNITLSTKEEIELFISKVLNEVIEELKKEKEEILKSLEGDNK